MTHPNVHTNGASLEDCHTNFFALMDLCGIKWRRLSAENLSCVDPLDDPVLVTFAKCLAADILCVWRRVPVQKVSAYDHHLHQQRYVDPPAPFLSKKELWIFWYGNEPDLKNMPCSDMLLEVEQGSWDTGLSYECRTLLFKAIHNRIERSLLSRDYVRLGKWFVQPTSGVDKPPSGASAVRSPYSLAFKFFIHGESTVCASVDVRQHAPVRRLAPAHHHAGVRVILAPYAQAGVFTGHVYKDGDKLLDEWRQYFPLDSASSGGGDTPASESVPKPPAAAAAAASFVEVVVGGVRMRYPACYVLVVDADDLGAAGPAPTTRPVSTSVQVTPPTSPRRFSPTTITESADAFSVSSRQIVSHVCQDQTVVTAHTSDDASGCIWDFCDPSAKSACSCSRCKKNRQWSGGGAAPMSSAVSMSLGGAGAINKRPDRAADKQSARSHVRSMTPFHRRTPIVMEDANTFDAAKKAPPPTIRAPTPLPMLKADPPRSVGSSAAPSPLAPSTSQPASVAAQPDPVMPTLSPHPPPDFLATSVDECADTPTQEADVKPEVANAAAAADCPSLPKVSSPLSNAAADSAASGAAVVVAKIKESPAHAPPIRAEHVMTLKRPVLPVSGYEELDEDEPLSESLYDYSSLHVWLQHPVKRLKHDCALASSPLDSAAAFAGGVARSSSSLATTDLPSPTGAGCMALTPTSLKPMTPFGGNDESSAQSSPKPADPYEFVDDFPTTVSMAGFKSKNEAGGAAAAVVVVKDEAAKDPPTPQETALDAAPSPLTPKTTPASLFREKDLVATYDDLNQLFDTSDDDTNHDAFHTPGSPKTLGGIFDERKSSGILGPTELSRMFPTPPSLEQASPCGGPVSVSDVAALEGADTALASSAAALGRSAASPAAAAQLDWSYVFRPLPIARCVGSSKYAPVANLPQAPPLPLHCVYRPSWLTQQPQQQQLHLWPSSAAGENKPAGSVDSLERLRSVEASPATFAGVGGAPFDLLLPSPAVSNASSGGASPTNCGGGGSRPDAEAHGLLATLLLSDSLLNVFKDHNFDSSTMCVCHMTIRGADVGTLLAPAVPAPADDDAFYACTCGFSAVVNRRLTCGAGLFADDEFEVTGLSPDPRLRRLSPLRGAGTDAVLELAALQCTAAAHRTFPAYRRRLTSATTTTDAAAVEVLDGCDATCTALDLALAAGRLDDAARSAVLHRWPFAAAAVPADNRELVKLLRALQPLLQEAVHKKPSTQFWEATTTATYTVSGPLTWRQFLRLAGRSTEDQCEPQPIPSLLVGYDKDWLAVSPFAIKYWEKLLLEPYSLSRDVAYVVVTPDEAHIVASVKSFFRELSATYEVCRLGKHAPITKVLMDGVMRVGRNAAKTLADEKVDCWFDDAAAGVAPTLATKLKLYAQVCRHHLAPHLATQPMDATLLEPPPAQRAPVANAAVIPPLSPMVLSASAASPVDAAAAAAAAAADRPPTPANAADDSQPRDAVTPAAPTQPTAQDEPDEDAQPPAIVVYMVDPFGGYGADDADDDDDEDRIAAVGLLRCYSELLGALPEHVQNNVNLQIVPLEAILEQQTSAPDRRRSARRADQLKALAFSVFSQCRRTLVHQSTVKSLTGFGPAAQADAFIRDKDERNSAPMRFYSPPFILAPMKDKQTQLTESFGGDQRERATVLYCAYCLSDDGRWLLAACTDDRGELLDTAVVNVDASARRQRRRGGAAAAARRAGLQKLMDWILGVMSASAAMPWRLVVGRVGRLGHGELKGWSHLLCKRTLVRFGRQLRAACRQCGCRQVAQDTPCILSACLVSLEADAALRVMADAFTPDADVGAFGASSCVTCELSTPQDASCTHILVFPTSAQTQAAQAAHGDAAIDALGANFHEEDILSALDEEGHTMSDISAIFNWTTAASPPSSPGADPSGGGSPPPPPPHQLLGLQGGGGGANGAVSSRGGGAGDDEDDNCDDAPLLQQQPLALGYYVSTARTGPLPRGFWATCRHLEDVCPAFLKSALHVHSPAVQQSSDDLFQAQSSLLQHPLDSNFTTDVLRYVLEGYNALSWLAVDPATHDRRSCLPLHVQALMHLYYTVAALA